MRVYILQANLNVYQTLVPIGQGIVEQYRRFNGEPLSGSLDDFPVEVVEEEKNLPVSDFPSLASHIPVFSQRSVNVLEGHLSRAGEMIPLNCANCEDEYLAMNVTRLVEALDEERSQVKRYRSSGRIMRVMQYEFLAERVKGVTTFKIPETVLQEVYVTEDFVTRVVGSGLRGFVFKLIWTDEAFVILCPYCLGIIEEETEECPTCGLETTRDAALEMRLEEARGMKREPCEYCGTRIREWADPCPYCKRGKQRDGVREEVVIA